MSKERNSSEVIDLQPVVGPAGDVVWAEPSDSPEPVEHRGDDVQRTDDGRLWLVKDDVRDRTLSTLPIERMAAVPDAWADVVRNLRAAEEGADHEDVVMNAGGSLEVVTPGQERRELSKLPQERMAGDGNPEPNLDEVTDVMTIDPDRTEQWTPVQTGLLNGWKFRLRPEQGASEFVFLAFRSPDDDDNFRIFVIKPDVDDEYGHRPHMISVTVGGEKIPVICGPNGRPARTLAEARAHAGKWMAYTYRRLNLHVTPGFSL